MSFVVTPMGSTHCTIQRKWLASDTHQTTLSTILKAFNRFIKICKLLGYKRCDYISSRHKQIRKKTLKEKQTSQCFGSFLPPSFAYQDGGALE